jgi:DNA repair exonuclease SbcCD ATPase subunit
MSDEAILSVETEIKAVNVKLDELEAAIEGARAAQDKDEVAALRKKEEQLRKKEEQLRKKEEQLRAEKLLLLAHQPGAPCRLASVHVAPRVHARRSSFVMSFVFWFRAWQSAGGLECAGPSQREL